MTKLFKNYPPAPNKQGVRNIKFNWGTEAGPPVLQTANGANQGVAMNSHFWDVYREIRSVIQKPDDAIYILHTSIGPIAVRKFVYRGEAGFVFFQGVDQSGKDRIVGFSEQQLSTFPFEIRMKSADNNGHIRFNPDVAESLSYSQSY